MNSVGQILAFLKDVVSNPLLYRVALFVSACLLFLPEKVLKTVKLDEFSTSYSIWIGLVFGISLSIPLVKLYGWIKDKIERHFKENALRKAMQNKLWELFPAERTIIISMYRSPDRSMRLPCSNPSVAILLSLKMIQYGSLYFDMVHDNPYYLRQWVCKYLDEHPEYLNSPFGGTDNVQ